LSRANLLTLLSDFGLRDSFVAQMKAVVLGLNPAVRLVDVTHEVAPGAILEAALALESCWRLFPAGSVHLAVVDPGVGSERAPLAIEAGGHLFVGPDNGLFTLVLEAHPEARAWRLREDLGPKQSATFHGRDVFAPAAARLTLGRAMDELGEPWAEPPNRRCVRLALPEVACEAGRVRGEVWHADRFGNLITNLRASHLRGRGVRQVAAGAWRGALARTYGDVPPGECLAYWGSAGYLEVGCRGASAARLLSLGPGAAVVIDTD